jgi:hypothetical protein
MGQATAASTADGAAGRNRRRFRGGHDRRLGNCRGGGLSLEHRRRRNLQRAAAGGGEPGRRRAASGIGGDAQRPRTVERCLPFLNGKAHHRAGHRLIVAIAHFDDRRDGRFLLNDVDRAFAVNDDDLQCRGLCVPWRRVRQLRPHRRPRAGYDRDEPAVLQIAETNQTDPMDAGGHRRQRQRRLAGQPAVDVHRRANRIRFNEERAGSVGRGDDALLSAHECDECDADGDAGPMSVCHGVNGD